jgi:predicted MPP superfamily phosphohydrolase
VRRRWRAIRGAGLAGAAVALAAAADATIVEPYRLTTTSVELPPGNLSRAMAGERIVHLSDLHFEGMGFHQRRLLARLRELDPALILMTGDYADTPEGIEALREFFGQIRPRLGIFAVPGNNDYFRGRQAEIFATLREAGVTVLVNDVALVEAGGGELAVAGIDDPFFGRDDLPGVLKRIPEGVPSILLAHSPSVLLERSEAILFNAGDADGPWGKGWFWTDGSHFREPVPALAFPGESPHRLRIQVREDGVALGAILLVPAGDAGPPSGIPRGLQGRGRRAPVGRPGTIEVDLCTAELRAPGGDWRLDRRDGGGCVLEHSGDRGRLASYPLAEPEESVELVFEAPPGLPYRVWVRLHSPTATGLSDSLYIQFADAMDVTGAPQYRIGAEIPGAGGPPLALILAGHTHGGQVRIPWFGPVERGLIPGPYISGRYDASGSLVYISRGIGTSILPIRFACAPEVVLFGGPAGEQES